MYLILEVLIKTDQVNLSFHFFLCNFVSKCVIHVVHNFKLAAKKETAREKQLKEEEKILESVTEKTGSFMKTYFLIAYL